MSDGQGHRVFNVLFLCTGNSARSILASLPVESLDRASLRTKLTEIGQSEGASSPRNNAA